MFTDILYLVYRYVPRASMNKKGKVRKNRDMVKKYEINAIFIDANDII